MSKNALTEVPDTINGCKSLTLLNISVNPLGKEFVQVIQSGASKFRRIDAYRLRVSWMRKKKLSLLRKVYIRTHELE